MIGLDKLKLWPGVIANDMNDSSKISENLLRSIFIAIPKKPGAT